MSSLEQLLLELLGGPDVTIVLGDSGTQITLEQFARLATDALDEADPLAAPKRDTPEYREAITHVARLDELEAVIGALTILHDDYGWRGPLDVMAEWIGQLEASPVTRSDYWRDITGTVDLRQIVVIDADEEQKLRMAADKKERYQEEGFAPHDAFRRGLAETESGIALGKRWLPVFRAALTAAHTTGERRAVLAELFKAPGRTDRDELLRGATFLASAAYGIRHHKTMAARYEAVAKGKEVTHDPAISPTWNSGGGYMTRSALRRR